MSGHGCLAHSDCCSSLVCDSTTKTCVACIPSNDSGCTETPIAAQVSVPAGPASVRRPGIPVLLTTTVAQARAATGLAVVQAKAASIVSCCNNNGITVVGTVTVAQATAPTDIAVIPALPMSTGCAAQVISCVMGIAVGPLRADAALLWPDQSCLGGSCCGNGGQLYFSR